MNCEGCRKEWEEVGRCFHAPAVIVTARIRAHGPASAAQLGGVQKREVE